MRASKDVVTTSSVRFDRKDYRLSESRDFDSRQGRKFGCAQTRDAPARLGTRR